jgi:hypothetical protein
MKRRPSAAIFPAAKTKQCADTAMVQKAHISGLPFPAQQKGSTIACTGRNQAE